MSPSVQEPPPVDSVCQRCYQPTRCLKHYEFPVIVFLVLQYDWRVEEVAFCPRCLRSYMRRWGLISILTANLIWPVTVLPIWTIRYISSYSPLPAPKRRALWKKLVGGAAVACLAMSMLVPMLLVVQLVGGFTEPDFRWKEDFFEPMLGFGTVAFVCTLVAAAADV